MKPQYTREKILHAAANLFNEEGYAAMTTQKIAQRAGVNEVTLFRQFKSKKNILLAAIKLLTPLDDLRQMLTSAMDGNYRDVLTNLGRQYLGMLLEQRDAILMGIAESRRIPELQETFASLPKILIGSLSKYLKKQIDKGIVRPLENVESYAQAFYGMFFEYATGPKLAANVNHENTIRHYVELFYLGTIKNQAQLT